MNGYQFYLERAVLERSGDIESIDEGLIDDAIGYFKKGISGLFGGVKEHLSDSKQLFKLIHQSYNVLSRQKRAEIEELLKFSGNRKNPIEERKAALKKVHRILIVKNPNKEVRTDLIKTLKRMTISTKGNVDPFAKLWGID